MSVNVGLLASAGYNLYNRPDLRSNSRVIGATAAGALLLMGAEGFVAEAYRTTEAGRREEKRAKEEGASLYKQTKELVLRPKVLGGLAGALNVAVLGTAGFLAYQHWHMPHWDRRVVSGVVVGLITLSLGEG